MKITALIPAHNDAYTLWFCLRSIGPHFDEIIVLDDRSTDRTRDVVELYGRPFPHIRISKPFARQLGWIESRNRLIAETDSDLLFFLDADDVLIESQAHLLREIAAGDRPVVRLQLAEMWGDFNHTTQRLRHYDRCHVFVNRRLFRDFTWGGGTAARIEAEGAISAAAGPGPLFWHMKGVKPDRRLVERQFMRRWMRNGMEGCSSDAMRGLGDEEIHARAMRMLLHSKQDKIRPYAGTPDWPQVVIDAPERFEIIYKDGKPIDRKDVGWNSRK